LDEKKVYREEALTAIQGAPPSSLRLYTDGGSAKIGQHRFCGFGVYAEWGAGDTLQSRSSAFSLSRGSSNMAELSAAGKAFEQAFLLLDAVPGITQVDLWTDSLVTINTLRGKQKPKANVALFRRVARLHRYLSRRCLVVLHWVPGHDGIPGNERADELATIGVNASCNGHGDAPLEVEEAVVLAAKSVELAAVPLKPLVIGCWNPGSFMTRTGGEGAEAFWDNEVIIKSKVAKAKANAINQMITLHSVDALLFQETWMSGKEHRDLLIKGFRFGGDNPGVCGSVHGYRHGLLSLWNPTTISKMDNVPAPVGADTMKSVFTQVTAKHLPEKFMVINYYFPYVDDYADGNFLQRVRGLIEDGWSIVMLGDSNTDISAKTWAAVESGKKQTAEGTRIHTVAQLVEMGLSIVNSTTVPTHSTGGKGGKLSKSVIDLCLVTPDMVSRVSLQFERLKVSRTGGSSGHHFMVCTIQREQDRKRRADVERTRIMKAQLNLSNAMRGDDPVLKGIGERCWEEIRLEYRASPQSFQRHDVDLITALSCAAAKRFESLARDFYRSADPLYQRKVQAEARKVQLQYKLSRARSGTQARARVADVETVAQELQGIQDEFEDRKLERQAGIDGQRLEEAIKSKSKSAFRALASVATNSVRDPQGVLNPSTLSSDKRKEFEQFWRKLWSESDSDPEVKQNVQDWLSSEGQPTAPWFEDGEPFSRRFSLAVKEDGSPWEVTTEEVVAALSKNPYGKAPGISGVRVDSLKMAPEWVLQETANVINTVIQEGRRPKVWDRCLLTLLYKTGDHLSPGNYRPINLTESLFRVAERVISNRMAVWYKAVIHENQFGFMPGLSTMHALFVLLTHFELAKSRWSAGGENEVHLLLGDLRKAFPRADWVHMLSELGRKGLDARSVQVLFCMLSGHKSVCGLGPGGFTAAVNRGVLEGGVNSPPEFNVFFDGCVTNDECAQHGSLLTGFPIASVKYADDNSLISDSKAGVGHLGEGCAQWAAGPSRAEYNVNKTEYFVLKKKPGIVYFDNGLPDAGAEDAEDAEDNGAGVYAEEADGEEVVVDNVEELADIPSTVQAFGAEVPQSKEVGILGMQISDEGVLYRPSAIHGIRDLVNNACLAWKARSRGVPTARARELLYNYLMPTALYGCEVSTVGSGVDFVMRQVALTVLHARHDTPSYSMCEFLGWVRPSKTAELQKVRFFLRLFQSDSSIIRNCLQSLVNANEAWAGWFRAAQGLAKKYAGVEVCDNIVEIWDAIATIPTAEANRLRLRKVALNDAVLLGLRNADELLATQEQAFWEPQFKCSIHPQLRNKPGKGAEIVRAATIPGAWSAFYMRFDQQAHNLRHWSLAPLAYACPCCQTTTELATPYHCVFECNGKRVSSFRSKADTRAYYRGRRVLLEYLPKADLPLGEDGLEVVGRERKELFLQWLTGPSLQLKDPLPKPNPHPTPIDLTIAEINSLVGACLALFYTRMVGYKAFRAEACEKARLALSPPPPLFPRSDSRPAIVERLLQSRTVGEFKAIMVWARATRWTLASASWSSSYTKVPGREEVYTPITHLNFLVTAERQLPLTLLPLRRHQLWWVANHRTTPYKGAVLGGDARRDPMANSFTSTIKPRLRAAREYLESETGWFLQLPWIFRYVNPFMEAFFACPDQARRANLLRLAGDDDPFGNEFARCIHYRRIRFSLKPEIAEYADRNPYQKRVFIRQIKKDWRKIATEVRIVAYDREEYDNPSIEVLNYVERILNLEQQGRMEDVPPLVHAMMVRLLIEGRVVAADDRPPDLRFQPNLEPSAYDESNYQSIGADIVWEEALLQ